MSIIYTPYSYVIFHPKTNKKYYGIQYGKNAHPSNLWTTYFTSSKVVKNLIEQYGKDSFVVKVHKIFESKEQALVWEQAFLTRIDAKNNDNWLNQHNGNGNFVNSGGYRQTPLTIAKKSGTNHYTARTGTSPQKGKVSRTIDQRKKYAISKTGNLNPRSSSCILYDNNGHVVNEFHTKKEAYEFIKTNCMPTSLLNFKVYNPHTITAKNLLFCRYVGYILVLRE